MLQRTLNHRAALNFVYNCDYLYQGKICYSLVIIVVNKQFLCREKNFKSSIDIIHICF